MQDSRGGIANAVDTTDTMREIGRDISEGRSAEAAEAQLDHFIERRHNERIRTEGERAEMEAWELSARIHASKLERDNAAKWRRFHLEQAERAERNAALIAAEHRRRAEVLEATEGGAA